MAPADGDRHALEVPTQWGPPAGHGGGDGGEPKTPWHRYVAALMRYKWLVLACTVIGTLGGFAVARSFAPDYEAHATIWIVPQERGQQRQRGPIEAGELLGTAAWVDLFRSFRVVEPVVRNRRLYLGYPQVDAVLFHDFGVGPTYRPGQYILTIDNRGQQYTLAMKEGIVERGVVGDSIGRTVGFHWRPTAQMVRRAQVARFSVAAMNDAADGLLLRTNTTLPDNSNFLRVTLTSKNPDEAAATLNAWLTQFVAEADTLKRKNISEVTRTIGDQLQIAQNRLRTSEDNLQRFQQQNIQTSTSASGVGLSGAGPTLGAATNNSTDPVVASYLGAKVQFDNLQQDIQSTQQVLAELKAGTGTPDALLAIPSLMVGADNLRVAITDYNAKEQTLSDLQRTYTDEYPAVQSAKRTVALIQTQQIPQFANMALARLRTQSAVLSKQLAAGGRVLDQVPARTINSVRLQREVQSGSDLYQNLQKSYEESRLAELSTIPDVNVLDRADAPRVPTRNTAVRTLMMAIAVGLGAGLGLALLLDRVDQRFRYPEQATDELGLDIIGTVPALPSSSRRAKDPEAASQVVEAFRTIRLHLIHMFDPSQPMVFTISSPGAGEGKSLISSNLGMSFAEGGRRTLLIDGDIRRGQLHGTFGVRQAPGLLDYLQGESTLDEVLQPTDFENLTLVTCGARRHRGPELLQSVAMAQFVAALKPLFDTIIIDSPPLGAGIDPFAIAHVTGNLMLVLRVGVSDRKMALAKLSAMDRLPVRQLGVVLNDVAATGVFRYYSYLYGYKLEEDELAQSLPASKVGGLTRRSIDSD
ncbi:MAG TPA: polysaccharide biosynthesis tyrosine autokinase [Gemmatimonadaceae bacterium]|nr:polysaccharide biosynthesis tyrosine autokinase [Gemmatimonadaceae bacterium]